MATALMDFWHLDEFGRKTNKRERQGRVFRREEKIRLTDECKSAKYMYCHSGGSAKLFKYLFNRKHFMMFFQSSLIFDCIRTMLFEG